MPNWYTRQKDAGKLRDFMKGVGISTMLAGPALLNVQREDPPSPNFVAPTTQPALQPSTQPSQTEEVLPSNQPATKPSPQPTKQTGIQIDVKKIIDIESGGRTRAVSGKGASGLMQVMPATWEEIVSKLGKGGDPEWRFEKGKFDRSKNIAVGGYYMNTEVPRLLKHFGIPDTVETRLAAYNWGIKGVKDAYNKLGDQWLSAAPMETQDYVRKYYSR